MLDFLFDVAGGAVKDHVDSMGKVGQQAMGCATVILLGIMMFFVCPNFWGILIWVGSIVLYFHIALSKRCAICRARMGAVSYRWDLDGKGKTRQVCSKCNLELRDKARDENPVQSWLPPPKQGDGGPSAP